MLKQAEDLGQLLEEEVRLVGTLLDVAERKRRAIIQGQTAQLAALSDEEEIAVAQLHAAERARVEAAAELAQCLDLPEGARLEGFEAALDGSARGRVREAGRALRERARRLSRENRHNGELLAECLAHVAGFFRILTGQTAAEAPLYAPEGAQAGAAGLRLVDEQA